MAVYYQPGYKPIKCKCGKHDCNCHLEIDCRPDKVISGCNNLTGASGVAVVAVGETVTPRNIGSLSLSGLRCRDQVLNLTTAIVTVNAALAVDTVITFRIFKRCGNEVENSILRCILWFSLNSWSINTSGLSICDHEDCNLTAALTG